MKTLPESILASLAIILVLMMASLFPGATELFTITMVIFSILYFPLGVIILNNIPFKNIFLRETYLEISGWRRLGSAYAGMTFWILIFGITFKLRILPGANELFTFGLGSLAVISIVTIFKLSKAKEKGFYRRMLIRCACFAIVSIPLSTRSTLTFVKVFHRDKPDYIKAYAEYELNPTRENLKKAEDTAAKYYDKNKEEQSK